MLVGRISRWWLCRRTVCPASFWLLDKRHDTEYWIPDTGKLDIMDSSSIVSGAVDGYARTVARRSSLVAAQGCLTEGGLKSLLSDLDPQHDANSLSHVCTHSQEAPATHSLPRYPCACTVSRQRFGGEYIHTYIHTYKTPWLAGMQEDACVCVSDRGVLVSLRSC